MKISLLLFLTLFSLGKVAAAADGSERINLQKRVYERATFDALYSAILAVVQAEGFVIKVEEKATGLIVASIQNYDKKSYWFNTQGDPKRFRKGEGLEFSANLEKGNRGEVTSRISFQRLDPFNLGTQSGYEILDPKLYVGFYEKVREQLDRRLTHH